MSVADHDGVLAAFDATAPDYDTQRRRLIPQFDLLYGAALDLIRDWGGPPRPRVLDLGAGTGLFAQMVLRALPDATMLLLDGSRSMLEQARARFPSDGSVGFRLADMAEVDLAPEWDLVVSSLAIHHLDDADKRRLFARIRTALCDGGLFVNVEQVSGPDDGGDLYERLWRRDIEANGATEAQIASATERMTFDRCATVEDQLRWMREAGFARVDCSVKAWRFAVLSGRARQGIARAVDK